MKTRFDSRYKFSDELDFVAPDPKWLTDPEILAPVIKRRDSQEFLKYSNKGLQIYKKV